MASVVSVATVVGGSVHDVMLGRESHGDHSGYGCDVSDHFESIVDETCETDLSTIDVIVLTSNKRTPT